MPIVISLQAGMIRLTFKFNNLFLWWLWIYRSCFCYTICIFRRSFILLLARFLLLPSTQTSKLTNLFITVIVFTRFLFANQCIIISIGNIIFSNPLILYIRFFIWSVNANYEPGKEFVTVSKRFNNSA